MLNLEKIQKQKNKIFEMLMKEVGEVYWEPGDDISSELNDEIENLEQLFSEMCTPDKREWEVTLICDGEVFLEKRISIKI